MIWLCVVIVVMYCDRRRCDHYHFMAQNKQINDVTMKKPFTLGILCKTYNEWECCAPSTPSHATTILSSSSSDNAPLMHVRFQPSPQQIFTNKKYHAAGAKRTPDLLPTNVVINMKQTRIPNIIPCSTTMYFSYIVKNRPKNMRLL